MIVLELDFVILLLALIKFDVSPISVVVVSVKLRLLPFHTDYYIYLHVAFDAKLLCNQRNAPCSYEAST